VDFELLVREAFHPGEQYCDLVSFEVTTKMAGAKESRTTAAVTIKAQVGVHSAMATGHGPVNALDLCLRRCLAPLYPSIASVRLTDYKVRVLEKSSGTGARVRVMVQQTDGDEIWTTVGVSENILEASYIALADGVRYKLLKECVPVPARASGMAGSSL
jgi:2-isopropylmalate synthase